MFKGRNSFIMENRIILPVQIFGMVVILDHREKREIVQDSCGNWIHYRRMVLQICGFLPLQKIHTSADQLNRPFKKPPVLMMTLCS